MRAELEMLLTELKRLKGIGLDNIYIADGRMDELRAATAPLRSVQKVKAVEHGTQAKAESRRLSSSCKSVTETVSKTSVIAPPPNIELPKGDKQMRWEWLRRRVLECSECKKHVKPSKHIVFGVGNLNADLFFCGEAPGADEETQGEPFVGAAGQLLTKIIEAAGLQRSDVYISNIMNWRPETQTGYGNRPPTQEEIHFCLPFLRTQIEVVQPKIIVALGKTAAKGLLGKDGEARMSDLRGRWFEFQGVSLMVTYHPSYLLHNNTLRTKRMVWEDMLMVMEKVTIPISQKQREFFLPKQ